MDVALRWLTAATTFPPHTLWWQSLVWLVAYAAIVIPVGLLTGLLTWEPVTDKRLALQAGAIAFFVPSLLEESIFRVIALPHPAEAGPRWLLWAAISLMIFIAVHPLNGMTYLKAARSTFIDPIFLACAGLLGALCTLLYWNSQSLWPPTVVHWLVVLVWLLLLGGLRRTSPPTDDKRAL
ncbi:MAG: CPBP family glutamic-type intramembrane protease [Cyanobacteria bacterium P01_G01_bin.4]